MHELGLAGEILRMCRARLPATPARLERVRIAVGELAAVEPDLLRYAWEAVTAAGPDRQSRLEVEWRPARQTCEDCGRDAVRHAGQWLRTCPTCGGTLGIAGGGDLELVEFAFRADVDSGAS